MLLKTRVFLDVVLCHSASIANVSSYPTALIFQVKQSQECNSLFLCLRHAFWLINVWYYTS
jgi:hypothetical protein